MARPVYQKRCIYNEEVARSRSNTQGVEAIFRAARKGLELETLVDRHALGIVPSRAARQIKVA
jgi:hypothetical protein